MDELEKRKDILKDIAERMNKSCVKWALVGSTNHLIQGMDVIPRDIDVIISYDDLEKVKGVFSDLDFEIKELPNGEAQEMIFKMRGFDIQICADYSHGKYYKKRQEEGSTIFVDIEEVSIPVFSLESEALCYEANGRLEKAERIRDFIKSRRKH